MYKSEVVTLFKLSSKSAIIIESKPTLPNVSFFSRFCICKVTAACEIYNILLAWVKFPSSDIALTILNWSKVKGNSLAGATGKNSPVGTSVTSFPEGGFYGAGQYGYTAASQSAEFTVTAIDATPSMANLNYDTDLSASNAGKMVLVTGTFTDAEQDSLSAKSCLAIIVFS